jgi:chloramphenicol 3-O phosphotransferase
MRFLYLLLLVPALFFGAICIYIYKKATTSQNIGSVIILNGPSGAGKSSIQRKFQELMMPNLWIKLGIDSLFDGPLPDINLENLAYWQQPNGIRWVETTTNADGKPVITLFVGEQGEKVIYGMNSAIATYAQNGCNVIVDYIAYKKEWIDDLRKKLVTIPTTWVKVAIPLDILETREAARGTSPQGHARSHFEHVYWDIPYDLEVNTDTQSAAEIARSIKDFLGL